MPPRPIVVPNLFIVGAQKAGTTTLASALAALPQVYLPAQKEMNFFSKPNWHGSIYDYLKHYPLRPGLSYWMDATPGYLWSPAEKVRPNGSASQDAPGHDMATAIRSFSGPRARIVMTLRHPVRRAVSAFYHHFRMGRIGTHDRIRTVGHRYGIVDLGFYSTHISHYLSIFDPKQIFIIGFEQISQRQEAALGDLLDWLEVDSRPMPFATEHSNEGLRLEKTEGSLRVAGGRESVRSLRKEPRFAKMPDIAPPIVEPADFDFLREVYVPEIEASRQIAPKVADAWDPALTFETWE